MLTLYPYRWYSMQYLFANASDEIYHYSPIYIKSIQPLKTGESLLRIEFFHANYSEGVRDKLYTIKVFDRTESFIVAKRADSGDDVLIVHEITLEWMKQHFVDFRVLEGDIQVVLSKQFRF